MTRQKPLGYDDLVRVTRGSWRGERGRICGYEGGRYNVRFAGRGRIAVHILLRRDELAAR